MTIDPGLPSVAPEDVGLSASRLHRIDTLMQRYVDEGKLANIVTMVCRQGKVAHFNCFGTQLFVWFTFVVIVHLYAVH